MIHALITIMENDPTDSYNNLIKQGVITSKSNYKGLLFFFSFYPGSTSGKKFKKVKN